MRPEPPKRKSLGRGTQATLCKVQSILGYVEKKAEVVAEIKLGTCPRAAPQRDLGGGVLKTLMDLVKDNGWDKDRACMMSLWSACTEA